MYSMRPGPPGIVRANPKNSSADSLLSLYHKIPEYSEVKHLGQSDFIREIEQLKEEFRQCRADLYTSSLEDGEESDEGVNKFKSCSPARKLTNIRNTNNTQQQNDFLKVKGHQSQMHRASGTSSLGNNYAINYLNYNKPSRSLSFNFDSSLRPKSTSRKEDLFSEDDDEEFDSESCGRDSNKWSSSPDLRDNVKNYVPPSNVERRILERKSHNQSAPSLFCPTENENEKPLFKAHPVPSHVYKPLYEFIMLKNQRRSQKVREQSKQRLMAQVKPFSFTKDKNSSNRQLFHGSFGQKSNQEKAQQSSTTQAKEVLNNMKPIKPKRACSNSHTNNLKSYSHFKANPAPPRTKALMSALKLKEQQEYRELKKRLRSETLLKNATLPPSMAARDKRTKLSNAKLDAIIQEYQNSCNSARDKNYNTGRVWSRNQSTDVDDTAFTDEDRLSEDSYRYLNSAGNPPNSETVGENDNPSGKNKRPRNFTPFGKSRHSSAASGIFECTSNDNLASRLRIQATRKKEAERIKREEEELLKLMRNENRRKKLRDSHFAAWRKAHSYSSQQDIAMRRQLRLAASILERESFVRDMSSMLCRVRSAPLLLEGVRERRFEPCRRHRDELTNNNQTLATGLTSRPKSFSTSNYFFQQYGLGDNDGQSRSETAAMAEGSLSDDTTHSSENSDIDDEDKKDVQQSNTPKPTPTPRKGLGQKKQLRIQSQSEDDNDDQIKGNQN